MRMNPPEPTPAQESMHEMQGEIAALKEQIVEAHRLLTIGSGQEPSADAQIVFVLDVQDWLSQNEHIVKEGVK